SAFFDDIAGVQTTFFMACAFPPPAAFALMLIWQSEAGAGLAANAGKTALMQAVVGHVEYFDVFPHLGGGPQRQRVVLGQLTITAFKRRIGFNRLHVRACAWALVAALAGNPGIQCAQLLTQRGNFTHATAFLVAILIKAE